MFGHSYMKFSKIYIMRCTTKDLLTPKTFFDEIVYVLLKQKSEKKQIKIYTHTIGSIKLSSKNMGKIK